MKKYRVVQLGTDWFRIQKKWLGLWWDAEIDDFGTIESAVDYINRRIASDAVAGMIVWP